MVVFLLLLSPVLVELVDFNSCVALLKQVKSLHRTSGKNSDRHSIFKQSFTQTESAEEKSSR